MTRPNTGLTVILQTTQAGPYQNVSILNFSQLRMEMVVTTGCIRHAKLQWDGHHQQTHI